MTSERIEATRRIAAPASAIFAIVSNPAGHVEIDGSGMLVAAPDASPVTEVGATFVMDMDREPLGDIPMGKYTVTNHVTRIEPDHLFEWGISVADRPQVGHLYGWLLDPVSDTETDVTNYCDWSALPEEYKSRWPIVPLEMMERSVENLERIVTGA